MIVCKRNILTLFFVLITVVVSAQERKGIDDDSAKKIIRHLEQQLNNYASDAIVANVDRGNKDTIILQGPSRDYVLANFIETIPYKNECKKKLDSIAPQIKNDLVRLQGGSVNDRVNISISEYLDFLSKFTAKDVVKFEIKYKSYSCNQKEDTAIVQAQWTVRSHKNSYTCDAKLRFVYDTNGKPKIDLVTMKGFKDTVNIEVIKILKPLLYQPSLNVAFGYKLINCLNFSIGIDGLSDHWFLDHLRFDVEVNYLYNQEHPHYSTASDGTPSQLTYISENGDFGIGMNIGYRIIPDKYGDLNWGPTWLSVSIGFGGVFYDKWWEYNGTSEGESHGRSAALYIKPSLCLEYLITDHFGMGIEAGYYFCPKYDPMQGLGLKVVTKFAL